jgi:cytidylate kinase
MIKKPYLILIDGPMGAGKTTISELLQKKLLKKKRMNALLHLDKLKWILSGYKMDSKIHLGLASDIGIIMAKEYIKRGYDVIVEKGFATNEYLKSFVNPFKNKAKILIYQMEAPINLRIKRIVNRELNRKKKIPMEKIKRNTEHYNELRYKKAVVFDTSKLTPAAITNKILGDIK